MGAFSALADMIISDTPPGEEAKVMKELYAMGALEKKQTLSRKRKTDFISCWVRWVSVILSVNVRLQQLNSWL